jgi:putative flippase GtrA
LTAALFSSRARFARFALTGMTAALVQLALLHLFTVRGISHLVANGVAFLVATQVNFGLSQVFTWRDRWTGLVGVMQRWLTYHGSVAGTALLNMAVFAAASTFLPPLGAAALGIAMASAVNFISGERLVFRLARAEVAPPPVAAIGAGRRALAAGREARHGEARGQDNDPIPSLCAYGLRRRRNDARGP